MNFIKFVKYRGERASVMFNEDDSSFYAIFLDATLEPTCQPINLGRFNYEYETDLKHLIDDKLDLVYSFSNSTKLRWFQNDNNWDIGLFNNNRILRVFLMKKKDDISISDLGKMIAESRTVLEKINIKTDSLLN